MKIVKLLTDNGSQFTHCFTSKARKPSGQHAFDRECALLGIEHRLAPPHHPQTNGLVERFNDRISDILATTRFRSGEELQATLERYAKLCNDHLPQRTLGHCTPLQAVRQWQTDRSGLFNSKSKNQMGLDTYRH